jgi:hypothetical protein
MKKNTAYAAITLSALLALDLSRGASAFETDANVDNSAIIGGSIRAKLLENRDQNKDVRNKLIEEHQDYKDRLEEKYEERREEWAGEGEDIEAKREALKAELRARLEDDVETRVEALVLKLEAHVERLSTLSDRIDSRIDKFEEKSINTVSVRSLLSSADLKIGVASTTVASVRAYAQEHGAELAATSTAQASAVALKALAQKAEDSLRLANQALIDTVIALKPGQLKLDAILKASATTTSSTR